MKQILLLGTGGTIAETRKGDKAIMLTAEELIKSVPAIASIASVTGVDFMRVPSPAIQFSDLLKLSQAVSKNISKSKTDGVIVTVGTDTLEELAYFLDLTVQTEKPLVVTGSMRSRFDSSSDTDYNLECAVLAASSEDLRGLGSVVVMNSEIHHSRYVSKTNTGSVGSFQSPGFGPLGVISRGKVMINNRIAARKLVPADSVDARVDLIRCCVGVDGSLIESAIERGAKGIVIEGFGGGDVTESMVQPIRDAVSQGVVVVLTSRCISGPLVQPALDFDGSSGALEKRGVILANNTSGVKARIKLTLALSNGMKPEAIREAFN